ncbi:ATP-dependent RNA helicase HrpA [Glaciihabitans sp. INWT7]|uniref:ATP-dependent RNA helicase HrpA n=1 Tax=Glaciihabitans sp. INWT7 TaxID=2596912 RepID=UPI00162AAD44|nr:ATP-dependent RNA helicase HrpA [Glaciihabitans sp. INWT7]QNE47732.1 ATP-dependent RNA helicase HrpA [Glaciihabitans sp. INWT7]
MTDVTTENATPAYAISYPEDLPVSQRRDDIAAAIRDHQVVIIAGETGSGKTTQLPKILLELGKTSIGHTQPRRIAARTIAERISDELGTPLGGLVGYQVRFTDTVGPDTRIKLMTDGILLNEIHRDRLLRKYDAIIIDEAHERSLTIDFLLGYLKQLMPQRPDLSIIVTSATIDPESFSRHFADAAGIGAPIVEVSGRTFPVEVRYRPLVAEASLEEEEDESEAEADLDPMEGINAALDELARESNGDVLVFLSGENEIRDAEEAIGGRNLPFTEVLPLYGRLSSAEQHRVFETGRSPGIRRRIVLATNVAETSLTVPGIKYVIDAGTARISRYSVRSKVQRLPIEAISQASANQRSGRSGRTSDGIAIRLYSEQDFMRRPEYTEPEILRTNLAAVILQMISLGLGDIARFPFLQPPDSRGIKDGLDLLRELGAVKAGSGDDPRITRIGKQLTQLPIDPRLARMVVESNQHGVTREVMAIVAGLSIQDPRERPLEKRAQADQAHARFVDPTSDFLTLLNLWNHLRDREKELSGNQFRRLCRSEYLNYLRVREWKDVFRQLERMAKPLGLVVGGASTNPNGIHRSLLAGLLSQLGIRDVAKKDYIGARQVRFSVFPGSALAKKQPAELMSAELVETSRLFARTNAAIDLSWAEPIAGDLVKRSYSEPHWERKQGSAVAWERVTLYGVPIVARRRAQFAKVDPAYARELFIRHALVDGDWDLDRVDKRVSAFDRANRALRTELAELEERTRRRDLLFDDEAVFDFYQRRIPTEITSQRLFETWWRTARRETPDLLTMTAENLIDEDEAAPVAELVETSYPKTWSQGDQQLSLGYRFEPGSDDDGVTVQVPIALLARLDPEGFDWQVPGFREELVTALLKSLPKAIRRNVVPANDWARRLLADLPEVSDGRSLRAAIAATITRLTYVPVAVTDFDESRIPSHLRMSFAVIDERSRTVATGTDLRALQEQLKTTVRESVARASVTPRSNLERAGLTGWDFDELPRTLDTKQGGNTIRAYPALVDEGASVAIRLMTTPLDQSREQRRGVRRMLLLAIPSPVSYVQDHLTQTEKLTLAQSPYRTTAELFADCMAVCIDAVIAGREIWTRGEFEAARDEISATIMEALFQTVSLLTKVIAGARDAEKAIKAASNIAMLSPLADAREQLSALVYPGFASQTGLSQLRRLPVYLAAIVHRIGKLGDNLGRDRVWMTEVQTATARYELAGGRLPLAPDSAASLVRARWLLEELRLSLFAQHLGTSEPVSLQRIVRALSD